MSWLDYILPKASNESKATSETSKGSQSSTPEKNQDIKFNKDTPDEYVSNYISAVTNTAEFKSSDLEHAFDGDAQKIKDLYQKNPIKVIVEPDDEPFRTAKTQNANRKIEELSDHVKKDADSKHLSKDEARALVKDPDFIMSYKYRENKIKSMAKENCADIEGAFKECLKNGSLFQRMNLCYQEHSVFSDCLSTQKEILEKIGYANPANTKEIDEQLAEAAYDVLLSAESQEAK
ncbi:hypothetical protein DSO57_1038908 [Entomophthora muscae]|uniref:Uncharacterized protein n=1 Tax=Entomophthora muscae TaxID=34485 RepID=A0ACC2RPF1_9FUNG|nr:hypothetical protein DSO57_1038908 [Entomophthora muscae]